MGRLNMTGARLDSMEFGGGNKYLTTRQTLAGTYTMDADEPMVLFLDPGGSGRTVLLPPEANGLSFGIVNTADGNENLTVKEDAGVTTIDTVGRGRVSWFYCDGTTWRSDGSEAATDVEQFFGGTPAVQQTVVTTVDSTTITTVKTAAITTVKTAAITTVKTAAITTVVSAAITTAAATTNTTFQGLIDAKVRLQALAINRIIAEMRSKATGVNRLSAEMRLKAIGVNRLSAETRLKGQGINRVIADSRSSSKAINQLITKLRTLNLFASS